MCRCDGEKRKCEFQQLCVDFRQSVGHNLAEVVVPVHHVLKMMEIRVSSINTWIRDAAVALECLVPCERPVDWCVRARATIYDSVRLNI